MAGKPKFFEFRPWVKPSPANSTNGDRFRLPSLPPVDATEERKANIKLAWFFVAVAALFVFANQLDHVKDTHHLNSGSFPAAGVNLTLFPLEKSGDRTGFSVRFHLSNNGNHSVFYLIDTATSVPVGELVVRASSTSDWTSLSSSSKQRVPALEELTKSNLRWIEMPPGGWIDSEFYDDGESPEEHAYAIYVKVARDGNAIRIVSKPYPSLAKQ